MSNKALTNPKAYSTWEGKEHKEENYDKLFEYSDVAPGPKGKADHGPKPRDMGEGEEVNNPTQGEQPSIPSGWSSSKEHKR